MRRLNSKTTWVFSDPHYNHKNICKGTSSWVDTSTCRDFASLDAMNDSIVESINSRVAESHTLICLGDWAFGGWRNIEVFRKRLLCRDIILLYGNHDERIRSDKTIRSLFSQTKDYLEFRSSTGQLFVCFHYGLRVWNCSHHGSVHLYGHSHGNLPPEGRSLDVGWDVWGRPLLLEEIEKMMEGKPALIVDHHNEKTN